MDHLWTPWRMHYIEGLGAESDGCVFLRQVGGR